ncbi:MAG: 4-(cytidine 5'-diphospho)-2-C-methyl-D-erythritol kinase [Candidatus Omnitrophica bacterium]|nr:4-(cytidine 5'-diphospho)-2-C-methyl-D-erythritol kinase [Candidatus Omnitrophota bacterium]
MKTLFLRSPAKLNLWLEVIEKRKDGYHNIESIIDTVSLYDRITLKESPGRIEVSLIKNSASVDGTGLPQEKNLAYQAALLLKSELKINQGVRIKIEKHIPLSSGLGGGSSNAATTLLGLNKLWRINLPSERLLGLATKLGSDVPFFLKKGRCLVKGRGEMIFPLSPFPKIWYVIVVPEIRVSTETVYHQLCLNLTKRKNRIKILSALDKGNLEKMGKYLFNRLEEVSLKKYPEIKDFKKTLRKSGALGALMSGSGGSLFGIARSKEDASGIASRLKRGKVFVVESKEGRDSDEQD